MATNKSRVIKYRILKAKYRILEAHINQAWFPKGPWSSGICLLAEAENDVSIATSLHCRWVFRHCVFDIYISSGRQCFAAVPLTYCWDATHLKTRHRRGKAMKFPKRNVVSISRESSIRDLRLDVHFTRKLFYDWHIVVHFATASSSRLNKTTTYKARRINFYLLSTLSIFRKNLCCRQKFRHLSPSYNIPGNYRCVLTFISVKTLNNTVAMHNVFD